MQLCVYAEGCSSTKKCLGTAFCSARRGGQGRFNAVSEFSPGVPYVQVPLVPSREGKIRYINKNVHRLECRIGSVCRRKKQKSVFLSGFSLELSGFSLEIPDFSLDISNIPEYSSVKSGTITASRPRPCQCDTVRPCGAVSSDPIAAADVASWLAGSCGVHSSWAAAAARAVPG